MKKGIVNGENLLVFYSNTNTHGKHDASGAFIPEATAFARLHKIPRKNMISMKLNKVKKSIRRHSVLGTISNLEKKWEGIFFFGHGWPQGIQFGFNRQNIPDLADVIAANCVKDVKIGLYACLTAENDLRDTNHNEVGPGTDGGFADLLRDDLVRQGIKKAWVDAHKTAGHASWNPFLVRFLCEDVDVPEIGATGGAWVVAPRSQLWKKWCKSLKVKKESMRHRFPFMTEMEIKEELLKAA